MNTMAKIVYVDEHGKRNGMLSEAITVDLARANKNVTPCQAKLLDRLTDIFLLGMDIPSQYLDEVKVTIPHMKMPQFIFIPMVEWLRDKCGIKFLEEKEDE